MAPVDAATVRGYLGDGAKALLRRALAERAPDEAALERAYESYVAHHARCCTDRCRLFPGVIEHLTTLRERGHPMAVVTNKPERAEKVEKIFREVEQEGLLRAPIAATLRGMLCGVMGDVRL